MKRNLQHNYDNRYDVLYVSVIPNEPSIGREQDEGIVIRKSKKTGDFVGVTIFDFKQRIENNNLPNVDEYLDINYLYSIYENMIN